MIQKFKRLWHNQKLLLLGFLIVSLFTLMFLGRAIFGAIYFKNHPDRPIEPWMPIGFIAKTYHVPPEILLEAVGIPKSDSIRRRIRRISQETGVPYEQLIDQMLRAIQDYRDERPRE